MKNILIHSLFYSSLLFSQSLYANNSLWTEVSLAQQRSVGQTQLKHMPDRYSLYQLDKVAMQQQLNTMAKSSQSNHILSIPLPSKEMIQLIVTETSVMAAELEAKFPEIKTYKVSVVGRPRVQGVINLNELGFYGMLLMENGQRLFIDPRQSASGENYYISYYDNDYHPVDKQKSQCQVDNTIIPAENALARIQSHESQLPLARAGTNLITYRLAIAATGEYTTYFGGSVSKALSAINITIARVNQIFERDLAIKLVLIANNEKIIFMDANSDPYLDNNNSSQMITENQTAIDSIIGDTNYDIGHVFTQGAGGLAQFQATCQDFSKAQAMTGHFAPENDPFDIDFVAHELGHQFGAEHSFNAKDGGCNRNAATAWEIGNGLTIMGYAGVCLEANDISEHAIAMFHTGSIREMSSFIDNPDTGSLCGTKSTLSNQQPSISAGSDHTIPAATPFTLVGTGSDADGDSLTYSWEQMDLGSIANISDGDTGNNPLFRVFLPSSANSRTFPQLSDILSNTQTKGEILPTTSRSLKFAVTVRDQKGGVADDETILTVIKTSTPFKITSHNTASPLSAGISTNITWDVGDTNVSPINCGQVNISLSIDGGNNFATTLVQNSSNDGSETITIPVNTASNSQTRFKVACSNNIFFDISDIDLSLSGSGVSPKVASATISEGNSDNPTNYFKLAISSPLSTDASVTFATRDGTALEGKDYITNSGTATIKAGTTETLIGITIIADTVSESDETFSLVISNPINGIFPSSVSEIIATHTIINDD